MLTRAGLVGAGTLAGSVLPSTSLALSRAAAPPDVGRKFFTDGRVMPFAGNTVICHLPQQGEGSEAFGALLDIYRAMPASRFTRKMAVLPPSSYHMTVIGGANDKDRRRPLWPAKVPLDASMAECNRFVGEQLRGVLLGEDAPPYKMTVDLTEPTASEGPLTLRLLPVDALTRDKLYRLRARLAEAMGIAIAVPDRYGFHITLGYDIAWLDAAEDAEFRQTFARWKREVVAKVPVIALGAPEYCTLDDMFHFSRQFYLK